MQPEHPYIPEVTPVELKSRTPFIIIVASGVLALLAAVGFYFYITRPVSTTTPDVVVPQGDNQLHQLENQSLSDDIPSIEADLNATSFDGIDAGAEELR